MFTCMPTFGFSKYDKGLAYLLVILTCGLLASCKVEKPLNHAEQIAKAGELKVGTIYGSTSYYLGKDGPSGFEYELIKGFADYLEVELKVVPSYNITELFPKLDRQDVDFLAAGLTITEQRQKKYRFAPSYQSVSQKLVFKQGKHKRPRTFADLSGDLLVTAGSSHAELLSNLDEAIQPDWKSTEQADPEELMQWVLNDNIDYTIVDSNALAINRRIYPELSIGFTVSDEQQIGWAFSRSEDDSLYALFIDYFGQINADGSLIALEDKYFGHVRQFNYVDTRAFLAAITKVLPKYRHWFEQYAQQYGIDWRLLAAISYQESHWNPRAKSPTGVRGIMMLTQPTAKQMGVKSRLDAESNIRGGARYFASLKKRIPARIDDPDRTWFALAAYNLGMGHMHDARIVAQRLGADPDKWIEVKSHMPKLRQKRFYRTTRYGYARGDEAVTYVSNIRRYYDSLLWLEQSNRLEKSPSQSQPLPISTEASE